jgi:heme-degrading monooxygenase HmoA
MAVTLINVFIVPEDREAEFIENWDRTVAVFAKKKGFIESHLHRNTGIGNRTFQFINIAKWESAGSWKRIHDDYQPTEYSLPGVKGHPSIYESLRNASYEGEEPQEPYTWVW